MKRTPLKRGKSALRRKSALKSVARGTARTAKDFTPAVRAEIRRRSGGWCEVAVTPNCQRRASHVHHRLTRAHGGLGTVDNGLDVCFVCHKYIHEHPQESYERGHLVRYSRDLAAG